MNSTTPVAATLTDAERKRNRFYCITACCFGCFGELLLDSSAIIFLYFIALGSSDTLTLLQTSFSPLLGFLLPIPLAGIVAKFGVKKIIRTSCMIGAISYCMMIPAPWMGDFGKYWCALCCLTYCISRPIWSGGWFPMLTHILLPEERAPFFGNLRFTYSIFIGLAFFIMGFFMGKNTPVWLLQTFLAVAALFSWLRWLIVSKVKLPGHIQSEPVNLKKALGISIRNAPLIMFSVYSCCLLLAYGSIGPFTVFYIKKGLECGDGLAQTLSVVTIAGAVIGYFLFGKVIRLIGTKKLQIGAHIVFILIPLGMFFCGKDTPFVLPLISTLLFLSSTAWAMMYASFSSEMLALARPGNTAMATAVYQTYQSFGSWMSRTVTSLLAGGTFLAASWDFNGFTVSHFQTIYLMAACGAIFFLILLFCLPSVVPKHEDYYNPGK